MAIFNSQQINTDPTPVVISYEGIDTKRVSEEYASQLPSRCYENGFGEAVRLRFAPRAEFDNNPNPILLDLRDYWRHMGVDMPDARCARIYLEGTAIERIAGSSPQHIDHAHKVLSRLANLTITNEGA